MLNAHYLFFEITVQIFFYYLVIRIRQVIIFYMEFVHFFTRNGEVTFDSTETG